MSKFGLIGYPLTHSFSKKYFSEKFSREGITDCSYENYPIETIEKVTELLLMPELKGLNVTIPYKEQVIKYIQRLDPVAARVGAVNTIKLSIDQSGLITTGYNTDVYGFSESLRPYLKEHHKQALILGTGGASKAVAYSLEQFGIEYVYVSRQKKHAGTIAYDEIDEALLSRYLLIVNSSPVGTYPNVSEAPLLPYALLTGRHLLFDLVYNPPETQFMKNGLKYGAMAANGYNMLTLQAEKAWEIWNS